MAGNLCTKKALNGFASDIFVILNAIDARLTIIDSGNVRSLVTPEQFLQLDMTNKLLYNILFPRHDGTSLFQSYKVCRILSEAKINGIAKSSKIFCR